MSFSMAKRTKENVLGKSDHRYRKWPPPVRVDGSRLTLRLRVQPGAHATGWAGRHGGTLRLRVAARAIDGQANAACVEFLARMARVARSAVVLVQGSRSRDKLFRIDGVSPEAAQALLEACST